MAASPPNGEERSAPRTTSVSVDDSETWVESKRYTVYKVVVRLSERSYFVFRRYILHVQHPVLPLQAESTHVLVRSTFIVASYEVY